MKKEFGTRPSIFDEKGLYGFAWEDYVTAIPSPLIVVTTYKENGKTNATLQSWSTFVSEKGFFCIFGNVNKSKHMYQTVKNGKHLVINFPSADIYGKCLATCAHNKDEDDEIIAAGLTAGKASKVNAPLIEECFLNLECEYVWDKEITPGSNSVVMCVKIVNICIEEDYLDENKKGRYGETGYLYNVHRPINPITGEEEVDHIGIIRKFAKSSEHIPQSEMKEK